MSDHQFSTRDVYLAAFLEFKGVTPHLEKQGQQIVFTFKNGKAHALVNDFNRGAQVPVADYVSTLKSLRGKMYQAKDGQ